MPRGNLTKDGAEDGDGEEKTPAPIDPTTRARVIESTNGKCWLCGLHGRHVTRVISKPDLPLFHEFQRQNLIHMPDLNAFENLIYLCPGCYDNFDDPVPVWAFLPANLDVFVTHEKEFQARRQTLAEAGKPCPRVPRPLEVQTLLYTRYQIRPGYLFTHVFTNTPKQSWRGSPIAAIIRSARVISGYERLSVAEGGLPMDVALKFQQLLLLYGTPESQILVPGDKVAETTVDIRPKVPGGTRGNEPDPAEPDLSQIGQAFNSIIEYANNRFHEYNLNPDAQEWLTTAVRTVVGRLKGELHKLYKNRDHPLLLPEYALNDQTYLALLLPDIPYPLVPYRPHFDDYISRLLKSCALSAKSHLSMFGNSLSFHITFASGSFANKAQTTGNRVFDPEFEEEFVNGVKALALFRT